MNSKILSIHGGDNSSVTFVDKNNQIRIFELERFTKIKNDSLETRDSKKNLKLNIKKKFYSYIKSNLKEDPKYILYSYLWKEDLSLLKSYFKNVKCIMMGHHTSHCIGAYQQSGFKDALVISLDGGGLDYMHYGISKEPDGTFINYSILKIIDNKVNVLLTSDNPNAKKIIPGAYPGVGLFIGQIKIYNQNDHLKIFKFLEYVKSNTPLKTDEYFFETPFYKLRRNLLTIPGKIMGLSSYGKIQKKWIDAVKNFYIHETNAKNIYSEKNTKYLITKLSSVMQRNLNIGSLDEIDSVDLAATNQHVFEELCWSLIKPYLDGCDLNVVFSGGCALNVIFNQKVSEYLNKTNRKLFVSPTPSDEGLSYGHICSIDKTIDSKQFSVYSGFDILDRERIPEYYDRYKKYNKVISMDVTKIVDLIKDGKIGATMIGYSEVGPRALGNRSIICDPSIAEMKDTLNAKVKFREWFRPFAPVCREEDKDKYFDDAFVSPYMTFSPSVKEEYRERLPAITHVDGTARLQTVTRDQHELFYDILTELDNRGHDAVILNTSFNIKGKPILTTVEDAFYVLENTELDFLILEEYLFLK